MNSRLLSNEMPWTETIFKACSSRKASLITQLLSPPECGGGSRFKRVSKNIVKLTMFSKALLLFDGDGVGFLEKVELNLLIKDILVY